MSKGSKKRAGTGGESGAAALAAKQARKKQSRKRSRGGKDIRGKTGPKPAGAGAGVKEKRPKQMQAPVDPDFVPPLVGTSVAIDMEEKKWYEVDVPDLGAPTMEASDAVVGIRREQAEDAARRFVKAVAAGEDGETSWLRSMMGTGTISDRVAAMTLYCQQQPMARLGVLDRLLVLCRKKGRREAQMAMEAVKDLFLNDLLPDRRLRLMRQQPLQHAGTRPVHLLLWAFEEELKRRYLAFVAALEQGSADTMPFFRTFCLRTAQELLSAKPEQEGVLLSLIVTKVGDRDRKIASKAVQLLLELVETHPRMKGVVVKETEQLMARPNLSERAQYYAATFLHQLPLTHADVALARRLLGLYLAHFERRVGRRVDGEEETVEAGADGASVKSGFTALTARTGFAPTTSKKEYRRMVSARLLSALLTGVNQALPFARVQGEALDRQADALFRVVFHAQFATAVQALALLLQVCAVRHSLLDRFHRALYAKLLSSELRATSRHTLFLNTVFRAIKGDPVPHRARAMLKRLLQVAAHMPAPFACAALVLAGFVFKARPELVAAITDAEPAPTSGAAKSGRQQGRGRVAEIKTATAAETAAAARGPGRADQDVDEELAAARAAEAAVAGDAAANAAADTGDASVAGAGAEAEGVGAAEAALAEALLGDVLAEAEAAEAEARRRGERREARGEDAKRRAAAEKAEQAVAAAEARGEAVAAYDPRARDPLFAGAGGAGLWEVAPLLGHAHPSVRALAEQLVATRGTGVHYEGDPLQDFTLSAFLDRFSYKNPKQSDVARAEGVGRMARRRKSSHAATADPVNTDDFARKSAASVRPEEQFFHRFFAERLRREGPRRKTGPGTDAELLEALEGGQEGEGEAAAAARAVARRGGNDDDDDEAEVDAFADELAEGLMRSHAAGTGAGTGEDDDSVDFGDDFMADVNAGSGGGDDDGDDGSVEFDTFEGAGPRVRGDDDDDDGAWADLDAAVGGMGDAGSDEGSEEEHEEEEEVVSKRARRRKASLRHQLKEKTSTIGQGGTSFVGADEFAEMLESAGSSGKPAAQVKWEARHDRPGRRGGMRGGRRGRGSRR